MFAARQIFREAIAAGLLAVLLAAPAVGQTAVGKAKPAPAAASASGIEQRLAPALALLRSGKSDAGIKALTAELAKAGADADAVAVILFHRGVAQARAGRHTSAIADLSQALHKKRLSPEQRAEALLARGGAYAAAGLKDRAKRDFAEAGAFDAPPAAEPAPVAVAQAPVEASGQVAAAAAPGWDTVAEPSAPAKVAARAPKTVMQPPEEPAGWQPDVAQAPAPLTPLAAAPAPAAPPAGETLSANAGTAPINAAQPSVADFFAGWWGGAPTQLSPPLEPAAGPVAVASLPTDAGAWSSTVSDTGADAGETVATATAAPIKRGNRKPATGTLLRLGALRSPEEAARLAEDLRATHGKLIGDLAVEIAPVTLGNMGLFYEVTAGPVAQKKGPEKLCERLQSAGVDCLVVTR